MPESSEPSMESPAALRSACDECISCLGELVNIHLVTDPPDRLIQPTDPDYVYRLRKALLHVKAITGWTLDTDVMHVIAPEIREALDQVDRVWEEAAHDLELDDIIPNQGWKAVRAKANRGTTSAYVHPSPQRLLLRREDGGLVPGDDQRYYAVMLDLLMQVTFRYAISLDYLSQRLGDPQVSPTTSVIPRLSALLASAMSMNPTGGDSANPR